MHILSNSGLSYVMIYNGRGSAVVDTQIQGLIVFQYVMVQRVHVRLNLLYRCIAEQSYTTLLGL
jgi:hypothetical protein